MNGENDFLDLLVDQLDKLRGDAGYLNRTSLVRRYALYLRDEGHCVDFAAMRDMLAFVDRGYSMKPDQISRALASLYSATENPLERMQNGWIVSIEGVRYESARSAGDALGISVQTVTRRIRSAAPEWSAWRRVET